MLLAVFTGILFALSAIPFGPLLKSKYAWIAGFVPLSLFIYFSLFIGKVNEQAFHFHYSWIPSAGINFDFHLDGLALLFSLLITGIGTLVFFYASYYLKGHPYLDRFFAYLGLFMAAMLGLVLSDNLIILFVFWELTSISSFFLIGFNNEDPESRKSSLLALSITGGGGLMLLAGFLLMGGISDTYSFQEMLQNGASIKSSAWFGLVLLFVFSGAFTKSAQFPFHFWLPGAMKAPTPVSTYLHSATMVKAGIYLLARFNPLLGDHHLWNNTLMIVGGITMVFAAFHTLFRTDLKGILAYSTISALGILVFLIGAGTADALMAAVTFILVHALYKAALFLITGIIDHETGTRDVSLLSGLRKVLMPVAVAGFLAALSNAGLPPFFGFVGKDLIYEAGLHHPDYSVWLITAAFITNLLLLYAGFQAGVKPFIGKLPDRFSSLHLPSPLLWVPPLILGLLSLLFGIMPSLADVGVLNQAAHSLNVQGAFAPLKLWHGFNTVLLLSLLTLAAGFALFLLVKPNSQKEQFIAKFDNIAPISLLYAFGDGFRAFAKAFTRTVQNGYLRIYVLTILVFMSALLAYKLLTDISFNVDFSTLSEITVYEAMIIVIMLAAIIMSVFSKSRLAAIASMGVVGFSVCLLFVFYSAPDLAMTQFAIDTLTVVMFVLIIYRLPRYLTYSNVVQRIRDGLVALLFGSLITVLVLEVLNETMNKETAEYYAQNAYLLAKGKNVVNVILVDFRGLDTMVEITVLSIAAIGVYGLLKLNVKLERKN
ncbi:MAG: putative monovalent cation/H+ antiporter subunit A [Flavobacteriales bacterium]